MNHTPSHKFTHTLLTIGFILVLGLGSAFAGAVVIDGTDASDHGSAPGAVNLNGWLYMQKVLENLAANVPPGAAKVVVDIGTEPGTRARDAIDSAFSKSSLPAAGWTIVHVNGAAAVGAWMAALSTSNTGILALPTSGGETFGDMDNAEQAAINANAAALANFVNNQGGALHAMVEEGLGAFGWLTTLIPGIMADYNAPSTDIITLTPAGNTAFPGLTNTDVTNATPWHAFFKGTLGALKILATGDNKEPLILGGGAGTILGIADPNVIEVSDQKPGSLLVFPFYKHDAQNRVDTRLTITNLGKLPINVHFLFMDGATCTEFDQFVCFTPNASIEWKASQFDPQNKGYVIAYTVDNMGRPIAYNGLIGNGFVNDGEYVGNYGAESFASPLPVGTPLGAVATPGVSWTIPFDAAALDMVPTTFAVDIQSPVDTVNQKIVLAGLTGDAYAGKLSGVTQIGTGLAYNGHEALRSFSPFISGQCFVEKIIDGTTPKVTGTLASLIPKGEVGTLRFNVTAAVGLLMTSNKNTFNGIRTLHKVQVVKSSIIIPLLMPDCQYWVTPS